MVDRTVNVSSGNLAPAAALGHHAPSPYVDWAAIIAGAIVATAIAVVFAGFGAALGLSALSAQEGEGSGRWSLILTGLWALITVLASYGAGGYVAGRMRRAADGVPASEAATRDSMHGMIVWGLGVLLGAWIASSAVQGAVSAASSVASGAAQAVGAVAQGAGAAAGGAAQAAGEAATGEGGLDLSGFNPIEAVNNRLLRGTGEAVDADATVSPVARDVIFDVARTGELTDDNRALLADELAANSTLTEEEANARIDEAVAQITQVRDDAAARLEEAEQAARDAADAARRGAVLTGFLIAAGFAIALGAAMFGAHVGGRHREEGTVWGGFRHY